MTRPTRDTTPTAPDGSRAAGDRSTPTAAGDPEGTDPATGVTTMPADDPTAGLRAALTGWARTHGVSPVFARLLARVGENAMDIAHQDDAMLAHLLHASLRSAVTDDGAPPEELAVLTAPDLHIEAEGRRVPLSPGKLPALAELRELLDSRRSLPYFSADPVDLETLSTLLDTALGSRELTLAYNRRDIPSRRFPSAGGLQPVDTYVVANRVTGLPQGIYRYNPVSVELVEQERGDFRQKLVDAAIHTDWLLFAPVVVVLAGDLSKVSWKYGSRGYRYLHVDVGLAAMNLHLTNHALGMHGNAVAAFDDDAMNTVLRLDGRWQFVDLLFAVGHAPRAVRR